MSESICICNCRSIYVYGVSIVALYYVVDIITLPLSRVLNVCLAQGYFPHALKVSSTVPLFKKAILNRCATEDPYI